MSKISNILVALAIIYTAGTFFAIDHTSYFVNVGIGAVIGALYILARGFYRRVRNWNRTLDMIMAEAVTLTPNNFIELNTDFWRKNVIVLSYDNEEKMYQSLAALDPEQQ